MSPYNGGMGVGILGVIEVGGVRLTAAKPALLLATLVAGSGDSVSNGRLIDALWQEAAPPSAADNLRIYVSQLRRSLGKSGRIVAGHGGYTLVLEPGELDADLFAEHLTAAARLRAEGDLEGAGELTAMDGFGDHDVDVIVGPVSNTVSEIIMEKAAGSGIAMISPSTTSTLLTEAYDRGLYFRTVPSDLLQGQLLGELIAEGPGETVAFVALDDSYSRTLIDQAQVALTARGVRTVAELSYPEGAADFTKVAEKIAKARASALAIIGFGETEDIVKALAKKGLTTSSQRWYLVDANLADYSETLPAGTLAGAKGTLAGADPSKEFRARMLKLDPRLQDFSYASEAYDAVVLAALAAEAGEGDLGPTVAARLADVSGGGQRCTDFGACADLLRAGTDIDYDGLSGRVEFDSYGDVGEGTFGVYTYRRDNNYVRTQTRAVRVSAF